ncbi:hypothetical protein [Thalassotalea litorea]|uniref:hypothetical protein n=1 Tax=Thalassotalea litorea TaxID=2020715 RepID=UPI0037354272
MKIIYFSLLFVALVSLVFVAATDDIEKPGNYLATPLIKPDRLPYTVSPLQSPCDDSNSVLPIRLKVSKAQKIYTYDSEISEDYLREKLESLPVGCDNARITFLYEKGTSVEYLKQVNDILEKSANFKNYSPIMMEYPEGVLH